VAQWDVFSVFIPFPVVSSSQHQFKLRLTQCVCYFSLIVIVVMGQLCVCVCLCFCICTFTFGDLAWRNFIVFICSILVLLLLLLLPLPLWYCSRSRGVIYVARSTTDTWTTLSWDKEDNKLRSCNRFPCERQQTGHSWAKESKERERRCEN